MLWNSTKRTGAQCQETLVANFSLEVAAACCLEADFSGAQLDVKRFEEGYVCKGCYREVDRLHILHISPALSLGYRVVAIVYFTKI